ncbi:MAG: DUF4468 domain-containing protein [Bacteroidales bacterium]|nr:DUF4468 domain-containing protein [Bacteroidales bacterium]
MKINIKSVLTVLAFSCASMNTFGQQDSVSKTPVPVDENTNLIVYKAVVQEEGTTTAFFKRAVKWINSVYVSPASVTSLRDMESGIIEGDYRFKIYATAEEGVNAEWGTITYAFKLEFRENRYRYTFSDFEVKGQSRHPLEDWIDKMNASENGYFEEKLIKVDNYMQDLIASLIESMQPEKVIVEEDW